MNGKNGTHHPVSGSFVFGVTTCDPLSIDSNQCHVTGPCIPGNSCGGSSLTFKVANCSTVGFFAHFYRNRESNAGFISVTIGKKTFPFLDPDNIFGSKQAYPFIMLSGAVDALAIITEDMMPELLPIGQQWVSKKTRTRKRNSDSVSSSSSSAAITTINASSASAAAVPVEPKHTSYIVYNSNNGSSRNSPIPPPSSPAASLDSSSGRSTGNRTLAGPVKSVPSNGPTPLKLMDNSSRTPSKSQPQPQTSTPVQSQRSSTGVMRTFISTPTKDSVLDREEFTLPKHGSTFPISCSFIPGEICNRSHAGTQTDLDSFSAEINSIPRTLQQVATTAVTANPICESCKKGPKQLANGIQPAPGKDQISSSERIWYGNHTVWHKGDVISPYDASSGKARYIFGNMLEEGQTIAFRVREVSMGQGGQWRSSAAANTIAFGFSRKFKRTFSDLPADVNDLNPHQTGPNGTRYVPPGSKTYYVRDNLLKDLSISFDDIITIKRVSRSIILNVGDRKLYKNIFTIEPFVELYPFFAFNGCITGITIIGGQKGKDTAAAPTHVHKDATDSIAAGAQDGEGSGETRVHKEKTNKSDNSSKNKQQQQQRSLSTTAKVMSSISILFLLSAAVYKYIHRK